MTITGVGDMTVSGSAKKLNKDQMDLKQGDIMEGRVVSLSDTSLSISVNNSDKVIEVALDKEVGLSIGDRVEVSVLKADLKSAQLSIRKLDEEKQELSSKMSESINTMEVKRAVLESETPLLYSKELDKHIQEAISKVEYLLNTFSDSELKSLLADGLDPEKMTIDLLYQVGQSRELDKKISLTEGKNPRVDIRVNEEKITKLIEEYGNKHLISQMDIDFFRSVSEKLESSGLPMDLDQFEKIASFVDKVDAIKNMSKEDLMHFIHSDKESTIKEMYKSLFIGNKSAQKDVIRPRDFQEIKDQVNQWVDEHFEVSDSGNQRFDKREIKDLVKDLVMKGLPLDQRTIETITFVNEPITQEETLDMAVAQLLKMEKPEDHTIISNIVKTPFLSKSEIQNLRLALEKTDRNTLVKVLEKSPQVTLKELSMQVQKMEETRGSDSELTKVSEAKDTGEISDVVEDQVDAAVKEIQILRYKMTYKAAMTLNIKGVDLKNDTIENIRRHLEELEMSSVKFRLEASHTEASLSQETEAKSGDNPGSSVSRGDPASKAIATLDQIRYIGRQLAVISSASIEDIGQAAVNLEEKTIESLAQIVSEGKESAQLAKAADTYDQFRTEVRSDLGDRIEKAFINVDDILDDLHLEKTAYNERAVEILGRNEMPITVENIEAVKELDMMLQQVIGRLLPSHVGDLVDMGVDVVNEPIENIVAYLDQIDSDHLIDPSEAAAKDLMALSKSGLSQGERQGILGVFRMLHTIEVSKGAAVGMMVNNQMEVTIENLFEVAKIIGSGKTEQSYIDLSVSDATGMLETISNMGQKIKEQIRSGFYEKNIEVGRLMKMIREGEVSPISSENPKSGAEEDNNQSNYRQETFKDLRQMEIQEKIQNFRELLTGLKNHPREILEKAIPMDLNLGQWKNLEGLSDNGFLLKDSMGGISQFFTQEELETFQNISDHYLDHLDEDGLIQFESKLGQLMKNVTQRVTDEMLKLKDDQIFKEEFPERLAEAKDQVVDKAKEVRQEVSLSKQLALDEDYYSIPVMVNGHIQEMNMYYFRQADREFERDENYSVYFSISTQNMGACNMRVDIGDDKVDLTMFATDDRGNRELKTYESQFVNLFEEVGMPIDRVNYSSFDFPKVIQEKQTTKQQNQIKRYHSRFEMTS